MENQTSFAQAEYAGKRRRTRRERFLAEMEAVVPWARLVALIVPFYPSGKRGRPPVGVEKMLRLPFLQLWYGLADAALEDALYDITSLRLFAGIDLGSQAVPDATTLLGFRHLLEKHNLAAAILAEVNALLEERGILLREGTIVDATIIAAPPSTKNKNRERDPEMHQTRKGKQWYFGLKAHVGVDAASGVVHTVTATAANVADIAETHRLLHGKEKRGLGDSGYTGVEKRPEIAARFPGVAWRIAAKRGNIKKMAEGPRKEILKAMEKCKAQLRAYVEHPFHVLEEPLRPPQGALPGPGQKHRPAPQPLRPGQPGHRQTAPAGGGGVSAPAKKTRRAPQRRGKTPFGNDRPPLFSR